MVIRLGLQIPNFTYPGVADDGLFDAVANLAVAGEQAGFDSVFVMDHFYQLPMLGPPDAAMLEAYTLLGALAARTTTARLGTLVTGVTYRNPAELAKEVTALDIISRGRAILGIGAAWHDVEHEALGFDFPPVGERMDRLEEALVICRAMFDGERPTIDGRYYRVKDAINSPAPIQQHLPIMVGGSGEKRTLKIAARHADAVNLTSGRDEIPRKLEVLAKHCADAGRDFGAINKSWLASAIVGSTPAEAEAVVDQRAQAMGLPSWAALDDNTKALLSARLLIGTPEQVAEMVVEAVGLGLDGVVLNFPGNGADADIVGATGRAVRAALAHA
ncbi:MAG: LLM class F420-dependent oxidoreductase [Acidimicrobiales bacterium]